MAAGFQRSINDSKTLLELLLELLESNKQLKKHLLFKKGQVFENRQN